MIINFDSVMREHMDYTDRTTLRAIAEAKGNNDKESQILTSLTERLYNKIVEKADQIDYSTISKSRGDITKIQNYETLTECLDIMYRLVAEYKQPTTPIDIVNTTILNIKNRTDIFKKAFVCKSPLLILIYNNMCMAVVNSISFLIATCVEYIKSPTADTFQIALDTVAYAKSLHSLLFTSCSDFNDACKSAEFDKAIKVCLDKSSLKLEASIANIKHDAPFLTDEEIENDEIIHDEDNVRITNEIGIIRHIGSGLAFLVKLVIPIIRTVVYYFFSTRQNVSDFFFVQAQLIEMNAYEMQYNSDMDPDKKKKVYEKQMKIASKFRNIANKWSITDSNAKNNANKMSKEDDQYKNTTNDIGYDSDSANDDDASIF